MDPFREDGLGEGYVKLLAGWLRASWPDAGLQILNKGISGNTVRDLQNRWQCDVLDFKPDWLSVMIGINDVWRQYDRLVPESEFVSADLYRELYGEILTSVRSHLSGLIVAAPYYLQNDLTDPMRQQMDEYRGISREIAKAFDAHFIDTQSVFDAYMEKADASTLADDRIHPNIIGHTLIAREYLRVFDVKL